MRHGCWSVPTEPIVVETVTYNWMHMHKYGTVGIIQLGRVKCMGVYGALQTMSSVCLYMYLYTYAIDTYVTQMHMTTKTKHCLIIN